MPAGTPLTTLNQILGFILESHQPPTKAGSIKFPDASVVIDTARHGKVQVDINDPESICEECVSGIVDSVNYPGECSTCEHCHGTATEPVEIVAAYTADRYTRDVKLTPAEEDLARAAYKARKEGE